MTLTELILYPVFPWGLAHHDDERKDSGVHSFRTYDSHVPLPVASLNMDDTQCIV